MHILFVCTGNTCRSPMCEAYFRHLLKTADVDGVTVGSAGLYAGGGMPASDGSIAVMKEFNIDLSSFRNVQINEELLDKSDLIVALSSSHRAHIGAMKPKALERVRLLLEFDDRPGADVFDPFGGSKKEYFACFQEMKPALENLLLELDKLK